MQERLPIGTTVFITLGYSDSTMRTIPGVIIEHRDGLFPYRVEYIDTDGCRFRQHEYYCYTTKEESENTWKTVDVFWNDARIEAEDESD